MDSAGFAAVFWMFIGLTLGAVAVIALADWVRRELRRQEDQRDPRWGAR